MTDIAVRPARKKSRPTDFFACIGKYRTCNNPALHGKLLCDECIPLDGLITVQKPSRILIRTHFSATSKYGQAIVSALEDDGVRVVRRTKDHQQVLEERRKLFFGGVRVFGEHDLQPLVTVEYAVNEMIYSGYRLRDLHILNLDEILENTDEEEQQGNRTVVFNYEYQPGETSLELSEYGKEILAKPFINCRVWVNLHDPVTRASVHCVELVSLQFKQDPRLRLKFARSVWGFEDVTDYSREENLESERNQILREINEFQVDMQAKTRTW